MTEPRTIEVKVRSWSENGEGEFVSYSVPLDGEMDVLNALEYIRAHCNPTVWYRSSCRRGVCGGCRMTIDGVLRLACETEIKDGMRIDPYRTREASND